MALTDETIRHLLKKISTDPINRFVFASKGEREVYLVGGYVRDVLLERIGFDRDYVVAGSLDAFLRTIASHMGGKIIRIGRYGLCRIVLRDGKTLDFSPLSGSIEEDVLARDFTINALAWSPKSGLLDYVGGLHDMAAGLIGAVNPENIARDPVRILRAYRLSCDLDFDIKEDTAYTLRRFGRLLKDEKSERITLEVCKIFNAPEPIRTLTTMARDNILGAIIYLNNRELSDHIKVLSRFVTLLDALPEKYNLRLDETFSQNLTRRGLLCIVHFLGGGAEHGLTLSSRIMDRIHKIEAGLGIHNKRGRISRHKLFELFECLGDAAEDFLIVRGLIRYLPEYTRYRRVMEKPSMSGEELLRYTGLMPGPALGSLIRALRRGQYLHDRWTRANTRRLIGKLRLGSYLT